MGVANPAPAAFAEGNVVNAVLVVQTLVEVHQLVDVQLANLTQTRTARATALGVVKAERLGVAHEGFAHAREEQAQQGVDIGVGAYGGAGVLGGLLLVDDDSYGQVLDGIDVRTSVLGQVLLYEGGKSVV